MESAGLKSIEMMIKNCSRKKMLMKMLPIGRGTIGVVR